MENYIGPYKIIKELGKGGTSISYLAIKPPLEREILLKVLYPQFAKDTEVIARFEREAKTMSKLKHHNIVQILDFGKTDGTYFIAMEYIEGEPLSSLLAKKKFFTEEEAIPIILGLLDALSHVHKKGIIHRDINPSNIIITTEGTPKLTDFGLAWTKESINITQEGTFLGTPSYMSLEQLKGEKIDQSTDIYSTGLIFIEMLTGIKCFSGKNYGEIIQNILTKEPKGIKEIEKMSHPNLVKIIKQMIEKDKEKRYKTADEVIFDIKKLTGSFIKKRKIKITTAISWAIVLGLFIGVGLSIKKIYSPQEIQKQEIKSIAPDTMEKMGLNLTSIKRERHTNEEKRDELPVITKHETPIINKQKPIIDKEISIYINITPYGKIYFDDKFVGESPPLLEIKTKKGKHTIIIKNPNLPDIKKEINIEEPQQLNINLLSEVSYLIVRVNPWAEIWINNKYYATTPIAEPIILLPGEYELKLRNPYYQDYVNKISLSKNDTLNIKFEFKK